jgi:cyclophilin family peptidyl-prolyl cis-trans isomerase
MKLATGICKISITLLLIFSSILILPACGQKLTDAQIIDKASKGMLDAKNYSVTTTSTIMLEGGSTANPSETINTICNGTVDQTNNAFKMSSNFNLLTGTSSTAQNQIIKLYLLNNVYYEDYSTGGTSQGWTNRASNGDDWKQISFVDIKKIQDLRTGAQMKPITQENIGGIPYYILDITADPKKLFNKMSQPGYVMQDAASITYWDDISKTVSAKIWISSKTYELTKMDYAMNFVVPPQFLDQSADTTEFKFNMQVTIQFSNINQAGLIVIPSEALTPAATSTPTATTTQAVTTTPSAPKSYSAAPPMTIDRNKTYTATIHTNYGDIVIQLFPKEAPITVNNFVFLARQGFYDGVIFHRVIKGFMIQGGDPTGTGMEGPGYQFKDELPTKRSYTKGIIAMANSGPNTNGSQFFIMLADYPLQKNYSIFGQVTSETQNVVDAIGNVPVDVPNSQSPRPTVDVHINTITITEN